MTGAATLDGLVGTVLVVEDEEPVRRAVARILERADHHPLLAGDAGEARARLSEEPVALALCDVGLPDGSGLELVAHIADSFPDTAVMMVTGTDDPAVAATALELGAYGYVVKPFRANELLIHVTNALHRRSLEIENREHRTRLQKLVADRTADLGRTLTELERAHEDLEESREITIERLSWAAEYRDPETGSHLRRMSRYSELLAVLAGLGRARAELVRLASPMHDLGKIGIPDEILLKTGRYTDEDRRIMSAHPEIGHRLLAGSGAELLDLAATIALTHHERWDGSGYPRGVAGEAIPVEGRIVAIADVFDALTSARRYKRAFTFDEAVATMEEERGRHFDPDLLDLFLGSIDDVEAIARAHPDPLVDAGG